MLFAWVRILLFCRYRTTLGQSTIPEMYREERTYYRLLQQERVNRLLRETRRGDNQHFQLLKVKMAVHSVVYLVEVAGIGLCRRKESIRRKEEGED